MSKKNESKPLKQTAVSGSKHEKKLTKLLEEALDILDKGSMFGIDWETTGEYYTKARKYLEKYE